MYRTFDIILQILIEGKTLYLDPIWVSQIDLMLDSYDYCWVSFSKV